MILFPDCKINLGLDIPARRGDGYHEIRTLMFPIRGLCDALELLPAPETTLTQTGLAVDCAPERNLCLKACRLMQERCGIPPVEIHLHKVVPFGAGLGGGSADAAFTIRGLNELFGVGLTVPEMESLAGELGSDTVFFVRNAPALSSGRGEILTPAAVPQLSGKHLLIIKPPFGVGTAEAYAGITPQRPGTPLEERLQAPLSAWKGSVTNAFEPSVFRLHPRLEVLKEALYGLGALYASLSGSGSALYGIFDQEIPVAELPSDLFTYQEVIR